MEGMEGMERIRRTSSTLERRSSADLKSVVKKLIFRVEELEPSETPDFLGAPTEA